MKKAISRILYLFLLGFVAVLLFSCAVIVVRQLDEKDRNKNNSTTLISIGEESNIFHRRIDELSLSSGDVSQKDEKRGLKSLSSTSEKELYTRLEKTVYNISDNVNSDNRFTTERAKIEGTRLSEESIVRAINAFLFDNPEVFWLDNLFGYGYSDDSTYVECYSVLSAKRCEECIDTFSKEIDKILSVTNSSDSEYVREKKIHDKLLEKCSYANNVYSMSDGWQYFSAYGAIVDGSAVCEGYSKAMQLLLNRSGIDCCTVRGTADNVKHMWNLVRIDGKWYHLDATWDENGGNTIYDYFNVNTEMISSNHQTSELASEAEDYDGALDNMNFYIPECNSLDMNYYYVEGIVISRIDDNTEKYIVSYIVSQAREGGKSIPIYISNDADYEETREHLLGENGSSFFRYIRSANAVLSDGNKISEKSIGINSNAERRTLRIDLR